MNRRMFIKSSVGVAVVGPTLLLEGCTPAQVVQDVEGVLKEAQAILTTAGQTAWAADFGAAYTALQAAYAVWDQSTTSTPGQKVAAALNALVAATAAILPNDPYSSLIDECVALADLALSFWTTASVSAIPNLHIGAAPRPTSYKQAKARWNALCVGQLAGAKL